MVGAHIRRSVCAWVEIARVTEPRLFADACCAGRWREITSEKPRSTMPVVPTLRVGAHVARAIVTREARLARAAPVAAVSMRKMRE